jgi:hypothetical protein
MRRAILVVTLRPDPRLGRALQRGWPGASRLAGGLAVLGGLALAMGGAA